MNTLSRLLLVTLALARTVSANDAFCFVPGSKGGGPFLQDRLPTLLAQKGVPFVAIHTGSQGDIHRRAEIFGHMIEAQLAQDPDFHCHVLGHSMGGITARYAMAHIQIQHPTMGRVPLSAIAKTFTTLSSPNEGSPATDSHWLRKDDPRREMSLEGVRKFNDPAFTETYSPYPDVPLYSFRTYIHDPMDHFSPVSLLGFDVIAKAQRRAGKSEINDGIVPIDSQSMGTVLADLHLPHFFFSLNYKYHGLRNRDFYELYWRFLQSQTPEALSELREGLAKYEVLIEQDPAMP